MRELIKNIVIIYNNDNNNISRLDTNAKNNI